MTAAAVASSHTIRIASALVAEGHEVATDGEHHWCSCGQLDTTEASSYGMSARAAAEHVGHVQAQANRA
jgi:hypothetical protein